MTRHWIKWCLGIAFLVSGCSTTKKNFETAPELLTASGTIKVSTRDEHNRSVTVAVKHLAKPERVQPGASIYVLWVQPFQLSGSPAQNIGAFTVDNEFSGDLEATTTHQKFDAFVTAEPSREATSPSGRRMLWTRLD